MALVPACGSNCIDDGFEWSQSKEECIGSATYTTTGETDTTEGTTTEGTATTGPTTTGETEGLVQVCKDADMDGQGDPNNCMQGDGDNPPPGYVPNADDCKDDDPNTYKGAAEIEFPDLCATDADDDGWAEPNPGPGIMGGSDCVDSNPDVFPGSAENEDLELCTEDKDGDGWGDVDPVPGADAGSDCDDDDSSAYPGAASKDNPDACTKDSDGDGYGDPTPPPGGEPGTDCDDNDASTFPGSAPNEEDPLGCYTDADDDDWGDDMPKDGVDVGSDCDDASAETYPGAAENEEDNVACMRDEDMDGWGDDSPDKPGVVSGSDCNDDDVEVYQNCADCTPNELFCEGGNSMLCNDSGTGSELDEFCDFGCDPEDGKCIVMLNVDAGPSLCIDQGATVQLEAMAVGGDGAYMWDWTPADSLNDPNIPNPEATPPAATTYTVTVTDGQNAMASDNVSVFIKDASLVLDDVSCKITNFKWGGTPKVNWDWDPDTVELCQLSNSTPTARFCGWSLDNASIQGHFQVKTTSDDDWVGMFFGLQPFDQMTEEPKQFYFMGWKQGNQVGTFCKAYENVGREGIIVKRIDVKDPENNPLDCGDFHAPADTSNSVLLADEAAFSEVGWKDNTPYIIDITHTPQNFTIKVIEEQSMVVVAEKTFEDNTYPNGQVAFYANSQQNACFYDFKTSCL